MFYSLLSAAVHLPVHIWAGANCSPASVLKQISDCLLAKRGKSKYLDSNTLHGAALPVPAPVSAPWTGAAAGTCPRIPPIYPQIPTFAPKSTPHPPSRNRKIFPPQNMLNKSLPAPHLQPSPHSANITELPILLEIKSILEWLCCKASRTHGTPKRSWHELSQLH